MGEGEELLQRVLEHPEDDGLRQVYGDWLSGQGDPRGELIALQYLKLARALTQLEERQEAALMWAHSATWIGPFAKVIMRPRFERGFLATCALDELPKKAIGHPCWATVRRIELEGATFGESLATFVDHPVMRALRELDGPIGDALPFLCREGSGRQLELLGIAGVLHQQATLELAVGLPALKRLWLRHATPDLWRLIRSPFAARLDELRSVDGDWELTFRRADGGLTSLDAVAAPGSRGAGVRVLQQLLAELAPEGLTALRLRFPEGANVDPMRMVGLESAVGLHRKLTTIDWPK